MQDIISSLIVRVKRISIKRRAWCVLKTESRINLDYSISLETWKVYGHTQKWPVVKKALDVRVHMLRLGLIWSQVQIPSSGHKKISGTLKYL